MDATSNSGLPDVCPYAATRRAGASVAILIVRLTREEYIIACGRFGCSPAWRCLSACKALSNRATRHGVRGTTQPTGGPSTAIGAALLGVTILGDAVPYSPSTPFASVRIHAQPGARNAPQPVAICAAAVCVPGRGHQARDPLHAAQ